MKWVTRLAGSLVKHVSSSQPSWHAKGALKVQMPVLASLSIANFQLHNLVELLAKRQAEEQGISDKLGKSVVSMLAEALNVATVGSTICKAPVDIC